MATGRRDFLPEETVVATGPGNAQVTYYRPFWRPVLAGTLFALSTFVLSWFLMLGFHVGINSYGGLALGPGAAIWQWITACIAFFFGGMIASAMTAGGGYYSPVYSPSAWLKGAVIWGVSIPLALVLYAFISQGYGVLTALNLPHAVAAPVSGTPVAPVTSMMWSGPHLGFYWSVFIALACGLIFSLVGSMAGCTCRTDRAA